MNLSDLPVLNAALNAFSFSCLCAGYYFIRNNRKEAHRACMLGAISASVLFLTSYLYYHFHAGRTIFLDPPWFRPIYLGLLLTHTVLAVVILPMIFITLRHALRQDFEKHRRIARWTLPIWLYVSSTGVLIYFLLYQIFPQARP